MAEDTGQERTEEATPRRKQQAREKGQVPSSRELNTMVMMLAAAGAVALLGSGIAQGIQELAVWNLQVSREQIFDVGTMFLLLEESILHAVLSLAPFFLVMILAAVVGPLMIGGVNFSMQAMVFKFDKLDPIKGLGRVFSIKGLVELIKALVKFLVIGTVAIVFLYYQFENYLSLGNEPVDLAMPHTMQLLIGAFITIASSLILIALVDVPFQIWDYKKQLKMTFQEVKDENKDTEGNPEVRSRVKRVQHEIAQRRMMSEVPEADVIITNPEHYSIALKYDPKTMAAPLLVAKGVDIIAMQIRRIANENNVPILEAPPLARSLYHTTEINAAIPAGLYLAVAQVLAYIFKLRKTNSTQYANQKMKDLDIPDDLQFDS
ncbi:Flagellar biosynthesis protein FlhB [hydrothermal vent metagenome]|uniref:Flagellar biosynthetic protein FlhB n=1 Tax=hydrothermal vent metagenome TaxID=652676 RepID=A0A3B1A5F8_9ZZZZ